MTLIPFAGADTPKKKRNFEALAISSLKSELAAMKRKYESAVALAESRETEIKRASYTIARLEQRLAEISKLAQCEPYSRAPKFTDRVLPAAILEKVSDYFGMKSDAIVGHGRARDISRARHVAIYFLRKMTGDTTVQIGRYLGGRDHSTILHGLKNIEEGMKIDHLLAMQIFDIKRKIEENTADASRAVVSEAAPSLPVPPSGEVAASIPFNEVGT